MAMSRCVKCDGTTFEAVRTESIRGTEFAFTFIQCAKCGGVVGVLEALNNSLYLLKIAEKFGVRV